MNAATLSVEKTISGPIRCGKMCERTIRMSLAPIIRAASTNSFSRSDSVIPRKTRAE